VECKEVGFVRNAPNQNVILFHGDKWPYSDSASTLALTTVSHNPETGEIFDADIEVNATMERLSVAASVPRNAYDLQSVLTHEVGHFLGLSHSSDPNATMIREYARGTSTLRSLDKDDRDGACAIYPNNQERAVSFSLSDSGWLRSGGCDPTPQGGFSSVCAEPRPAPLPSRAPVKSAGGCHAGKARGAVIGTNNRRPLGWVGVAVAVAVMPAVRRLRCRCAPRRGRPMGPA